MEFIERYDVDRIKALSRVNLDTYKVMTNSENKKKSDLESSFKLFKKFCSHYNIKNGVSIVSYSQNNSRGRYYATTPSVQGLSKYIRSFLCKDKLIDIDIENCYPVILKYICKLNAIECPNLTYYINERDVIIKNSNVPQGTIKTQIFTIIFGGKIVKKTGFIKKFSDEYNEILKKLETMSDYKKYIEISDKESNKEGSALFKMIEDIEIMIIKEAIDFLRERGLKIHTYMYDGVMVYKEKYINSILKDMTDMINSKFPDLNIKFVNKEFIDCSIVENVLREADNDCEVGTYDEVKEKFEKNVAKIIDLSMFVVEQRDKKTGKVTEFKLFSESNLKTSYKHLVYSYENEKNGEIVTGSFVSKWLFDPDMRLYEKMDMFPPDIEAPKNVYNTWTDFSAEFICDYVENMEAVEFIKNHIKIVCGNDEIVTEYFIKWIAHLIQFPSVKTIMPVFVSKEGAGKGRFLEFLVRMLGKKKVLDTKEPERDVWGQFNSLMENCLLVCLNELCKSSQRDALGRIKGLITDPTITINQKGQQQRVIKSFHRFISSSNNHDSIYTSEQDRRTLILRCSDEKIGDYEYFEKLSEYIDDDNVVKTFYEYLKNMPDIKDFPKLKVPFSEYHQNLKLMNKDVEIQFLEDLCLNNLDRSEVILSSQQLYEKFVEFTSNNGIKYSTTSIKLIVYIKNSKPKCISEIRSNSSRKHKINIASLKRELGIDVNMFE